MSKVQTTNRHVLNLLLSSNSWSIYKELMRAIEKHPLWDEDLRIRANFINEECGEFAKSCNEYYEATTEEECAMKLEEIEKEAIQTIATLLRFLAHLKSDAVALPDHLQPDLKPMTAEQAQQLCALMDDIAKGRYARRDSAVRELEQLIGA